MNETRNIIASLEFGEKESQICYYDRKEKVLKADKIFVARQ